MSGATCHPEYHVGCAPRQTKTKQHSQEFLMLNKKLLVATIAAVFATSATAAIDTNTTTAADVGTVKFANEAIPTLTDGAFELTNLNNALDIEAQIGFSIPANATRYARIDLANGEFSATPAITGAGFTSSIAQGGNGSSSVIFLITAGGLDVAETVVATVAAATFDVMPAGALSVTYGLYETAGAAVAKSTPLASSSATMVTYANANTGKLTGAEKATATVASQFTAFSTVAADGADTTDTATVASVLRLTPNASVVDGDFIGPTGADYTDAMLFGAASQDVTFTGKFGFGDWSLDAPSCGNGQNAVVINDAKTSATADVVVNTDELLLCVTVDGEEAIEKGSYSVMIEKPLTSVSDAGSIVFDTTSVTIPYLTTFADYNQRVYIRNDSSVAASYTTSFVSEAGVTAVAGSAATGSVPANSLIAIKASDLVTLTGKTRTSAVIEIEATAVNVTATTQTVNLSDKSTDTVKLDVQ